MIFLVVIVLTLVATSCREDPEVSGTRLADTLGPNIIKSSTISETPVELQTQETVEESEIGPSPIAPQEPTPSVNGAATVPDETQLAVRSPTFEPAEQTPAPSLLQSITLVPVVGEFIRPTDLVHANDERVFVAEQGGVVWIVEDGERVSEPFLDITNLVRSAQLEQGLLSLVFDPNYPEVKNFYVYYTDLRGDVVVSRFEVDPEKPNRALPGSEEILLLIEQPFANHNGGQLRFGPDSLLYIGVGDGGGGGDQFNNGQNPTTFLGTLLRIGVNVESGYVIPSDNPFVDVESIPSEIWSIGLRNPWRFSFDKETGALYLSDVGQARWEEINFQQPGQGGGANYGWNITEGSHCFDAETCERDGFVDPVVEYSHTEGGCSVTGGYVYRGQLFPEMWGNYIFGDYCSGIIWSLIQESSGQWDKNLLLEVGFTISSFGEDVNGELYALDHTSGTIYHLQP